MSLNLYHVRKVYVSLLRLGLLSHLQHRSTHFAFISLLMDYLRERFITHSLLYLPSENTTDAYRIMNRGKRGRRKATRDSSLYFSCPVSFPVVDFIYAKELKHKLVIMYNEYERIGLEGLTLREDAFGEEFVQEHNSHEIQGITTNNRAKRRTNPTSQQSAGLSAHRHETPPQWFLHSLLTDSSEKLLYFPHVHPEFYISLKVDQILRYPHLERILRRHLLTRYESRFIPQLTWMLCLMDDQIQAFLNALSPSEYHTLADQANALLSDYGDFLQNTALQQPRHHIFKRFAKEYIIKQDRSSLTSAAESHLFDPMAYYEPIIDFLGITLIQWHMMHHVYSLQTLSYSIADKFPLPKDFSENALDEHLPWLQSSLGASYKLSYLFLRGMKRQCHTPRHVMPMLMFVESQMRFNSLQYISTELHTILKVYQSQLEEYDNNTMMPYLLEFLLDVLCKLSASCHETDELVEVLLASSTADQARKMLHPCSHPFLRAACEFAREEMQALEIKGDVQQKVENEYFLQ